MLSYIIRRLLGVLPVMLVVGIFVFSLLHLAPGDPAAIIAGDNATEANVARIRANLGLDRPLLEQFASWGWATVRGDLGVSMFSNIAVSTLVEQRIGPTVSLAATTMLVAISVAITRRDYPIIQGVMVVFAAVYVLINLVIDILYCFIDPRIRYT